MNNFKTLVIIAFTALSAVSCSEEAPSPELECIDYDRNEISVEFTPGYYIQGEIIAKSNYSGAISLICTNYPVLIAESNSSRGEYISEVSGFSIVKSGANTVKITFRPIGTAEAIPSPESVRLTGQNKGQSNSCTIKIGRAK